MHRVTLWYNARGEVIQVAAAVSEAETWDIAAEAVEPVGPFDDASDVIDRAVLTARNLAAGQYPGQLQLAVD